MTEQNETKTTNNIVDELRLLGANLVAALREAWSSPEREKLQEEIQTGLADLGSSLKKAVNEFETGPTGQRMKADVEDLGARVRSGEVESKLRSELLQVLRTVNTELEKVASNMEKNPAEPQEEQES